MYPLLIKIGPVPIHTYGFLIAVGFLCAVFTARTLARRSGLDSERIVDLAFWLLLVGFVGSRVLFILTRLSYFVDDPMAIFRVWEGGLVFLGGPITALPFAIWYLRKHRMPFWRAADCILPGVAIAHVLGRLGCLSSGCCYGKPTDLPWAITLYSELVDPSLRGVPLHPTQLYESSSLFILFLGLLWVFKKKAFDGQVTLTYFMVYPIIRSIIEVFRGDLIRGFVIEDLVSTSQFISFLIFVLATYALFRRLKQVHPPQKANSTQ